MTPWSSPLVRRTRGQELPDVARRPETPGRRVCTRRVPGAFYWKAGHVQMTTGFMHGIFAWTVAHTD